MLRSYRLLFVAIAGLILAGASPPRDSGKKEPEQPNAAVEQSLRDIAAALNDANKPDQTTKPCPKGQENRSSDLCAQWKAADAAKESADWTRRAFWLGLVGLVVGMLTFGAAFAAAIFAKRAADEAKRGADSAVNTYKAYVALEGAGVVVSPSYVGVRALDQPISVQVSAHCVGRSKGVIIGVEYTLSESPKYPPMFDKSFEGEKGEADAWYGNTPFFVKGVVHFSDPVSSLRIKHFCFMLDITPCDQSDHPGLGVTEYKVVPLTDWPGDS